jgi:hypothetical protein
MSANASSKPVQFPGLRLSFCLFIVLWLILMLAGRSAMFRDPGTFWHVVVGEKILSTGQVPQRDNFSFTRHGQPWISDYWLAEIALAAIHRLTGWDGLLTITAAILAGIYTFITIRLLRAGIHWLLAGTILALVFLASSHQFHVRPLILTIAGLTITFGMLVDVEAGRKSLHSCWLLAPLFILWANMHGGVLAGVGCFGLCGLGWFLLWVAGKDSPINNVRQVLEMLLLIAVILLSLLVNPYGANLIHSWFVTLSMPLSKVIQEHGPLDLAAPIGLATLTLGLIYAIVLLSTLPQRPRITWLMPLVFFALSVRVRNTPLFALTAVLSLPDMLPYSRLADWLKRRNWLSVFSTMPSPGAHTRRIPCFFTNSLLPMALVALVLTLQTTDISMPILGKGWVRFDSATWPVELLPELKKINGQASPTDRRIFNDLRFGGYLIYHTPDLKIFIDDRCSLYGSKFLLAYDAARRNDPKQIDLWQQQCHFRYALVEAGGPFDRHLRKSAHWTMLGQSAAATLFQFNL